MTDTTAGAARAAGRRHWEAVARSWAHTGRDALWREHSDAVNCLLIERWAPSERLGVVLKTDAFDEVASAGLASALDRRARLVVYSDLSLEILRRARAANPSLRAVCCDVRDLPFAAGSIDAVVSNSTLDHFPDVGAISTSLRELGRVLRRGGRLLLTLDNLANPLIALRQTLPQALLQKAGLVPYFVGATLGPTRLRRFLADSGFAVRWLGAILHCPRVLAVPVSRLIQRHGSRESRERFLAGVLAFERLERWPTRYLSGHFVAVSAVIRAECDPASPARASGTDYSSSDASDRS